jgi:8-oxo-dGTP pyrophosphatase MutT (NUDIX family)
MIASFGSAVAEAFKSFWRRPSIFQLAALCHRQTDAGREVLLITSSRGRWILPKGWPIDGLSDGQTAMQEAWEEGGVKRGKVTDTPIGRFNTFKRYENGAEVPCRTTVYGVDVKETSTSFPEAARRRRKWVSIQDAMKMVDEKGVRDLLARF